MGLSRHLTLPRWLAVSGKGNISANAGEATKMQTLKINKLLFQKNRRVFTNGSDAVRFDTGFIYIKDVDVTRK